MSLAGVLALALAWSRLDADESVRVAQEALSTLEAKTYAGLDEALIRERCDAVLEAATAA